MTTTSTFKVPRCGECDEVATHCCSTCDGWLYFCRDHALLHRKRCQACIEKRADAGRAP